VLPRGEVDFVASRKGETAYVQVALKLLHQEAIEREFGNLLSIPDNHPKLLVTLDPYSGASVKGVKVVPLREFLSMEELVGW
jgi:uncharacterized protein